MILDYFLTQTVPAQDRGTPHLSRHSLAVQRRTHVGISFTSFRTVYALDLVDSTCVFLDVIADGVKQSPPPPWNSSSSQWRDTPRCTHVFLSARVSHRICDLAYIGSRWATAQDVFYVCLLKKQFSSARHVITISDFLFQVSYLDPFSDLTKLVYEDADWGWLKTILDTRSVGLSLEG